MEFTFKVKSYGFEEIDDSVWISALNYNGLTRIEKANGRIADIYQYPDYPVWDHWLYSRPVICGRHIVSIPFRSKYVCIFNMDTHEFHNLEIDEHYIIPDKGGASLNGFAYKKCVYILPAFLRCVVKVDVEEMTLTYLTAGMERIIKDASDNDLVFRQQYEWRDNKAYVALSCLGGYAAFDPDEERIEVFHVGTTEKVVTIDHVGDNTYLGCWNEKKVYVIDPSGTTREIIDFPRDYYFDKYSIANSCVIGKRIYYFPQRANMIIGFNTITGIFDRTIALPDAEKDDIHTYAVEGQALIMDDCLGIKELYERDNETELRTALLFDVKYNSALLSEYLISNGFLRMGYEQEIMDLNRFVTIITGKVE